MIPAVSDQIVTVTEWQTSVLPNIKIRPATQAENRQLLPWKTCQKSPCEFPEVVEYKDGTATHAPETLAAYRRVTAGWSKDFTLVYVHRGYWAECLTPLLQSLLFRAGHSGPAYALRSEDHSQLPPEILDFSRVHVRDGAPCLILDDRQQRVGPQGDLQAAPVVLTCLTRGLDTGVMGQNRTHQPGSNATYVLEEVKG